MARTTKAKHGKRVRHTARHSASRAKSDRSAPSTRRYWSHDVMRRSDALDLEPKVFTRSALEIARSLKRSADRSTRRKSSPFRAAMSMLTFYENRAGRNLPAQRKRVLRNAKHALRRLYGRE